VHAGLQANVRRRGTSSRERAFELEQALRQEHELALRHDVTAKPGHGAVAGTEWGCPARHQAAARSANFAYRRRNESFTVSVGPFRCLATCTSARPCWSDSAS
jgi:hypothetical protein